MGEADVELVAIAYEAFNRGRGGGAEVKVRVAHLLRFRDARLVWGKVYPKAEEGLRATGVEP